MNTVGPEANTAVLLRPKQVRMQQADQWRHSLIAALLAQTDKPLEDVASNVGLADVDELVNETNRLCGRSPVNLRQSESTQLESPLPLNTIILRLPVNGAYNYDWVFGYLQGRALHNIEEVSGHCYRRRISSAGTPAHWIEVKVHRGVLLASIPLCSIPAVELLARIQRLFDLGVDGDEIDSALIDANSTLIGESVAEAPGLRVPGAWDGFETMVRALLGQQVSVARGTELANRMIDAYGQGDFPKPEQLVDREIAELGMPGNRGRAISALAGWVARENHALLEGVASEHFVSQICQIKGIGPWTQNYMRLRVVKDPDAFPHSDWVVLKQLDTTPARALRQSEEWRPWRAYALMHIWRLAGLKRKAKKDLVSKKSKH